MAHIIEGFVSGLMYQVPAASTSNDYPVFLRDVEDNALLTVLD